MPEVVVSSGQTERLWVRDAGWSGVRVVEAPLDKCLLSQETDSPVRRAVVQLAVEPGETISLSGSSVPWYLGGADEALEYAALQSRIAGERQAKAMLSVSEQQAGTYEDRTGRTVLAVKVSHKCKCDEKNWSESACGHSYCKLCDGYVDVESRVVAKGPGPIIKCCRRPLNKGEYQSLF